MKDNALLPLGLLAGGLLIAAAVKAKRSVNTTPTVRQIEAAIEGMLAQERASRPVELVQTIAQAIHAACAEQGLDPALLIASGYTESRYNPRAVSSIGARGVWQQLPQYGRFYSDACWDTAANRPGCSWSEASALPQEPDLYVYDVPQAARISARHFGYLMRRYGSLREAICRYAAGLRGEDCAAGGDYADLLDQRMTLARTFY
jgi:soluble lytic murein transglycosylase-like protein